jgi:processing peptidase subunit beta
MNLEDYSKLFNILLTYYNSKNSPPGLERKNVNKPIYTPSCMFMRDDDFYNAGVGVFFDAPSWHHEDYYSFLLLERIMGQYSMDRNGAANLNDPGKQYSTLEAHCGQLPDVTKAQSIFSPYKDCGLFGTYVYGNEVFIRYMTHMGCSIPANYGQYMNQVEVFRARARLWQELLNIQSPTDVLQLIGPQVLYLGRRVHRSEIAKRVAYLDNHQMMKICREWLSDAEPSIVAYGAIESLTMTASYKFFKYNTYVTTNNYLHPLAMA